MYPLYSFNHNIFKVLTLQTWLFLFMDPKKGRVLIKMNLNGPNDNVPFSNISHYNKGHGSPDMWYLKCVSGDIIQCMNLCVRFAWVARKHSYSPRSLERWRVPSIWKAEESQCTGKFHLEPLYKALVPSTYFFHSYLLCLIKHMVVSISSLTKFEHCCHSFVAQFQTLALNSIDWMLMLSYAS